MAIKALAWMVRVFEPPVYCYHEIVHNQVVVDRFRQLGSSSSTTSPTSRPAGPSCSPPTGPPQRWWRPPGPRWRPVVNAVCPLVTKVHHEVKLRASKGYTIVYVGHEGHEEAVGTMAVAPEPIHRVESVAEVMALPEPDGPVAFLAQTTLAVDEWRSILEAAQQRWPDLWVPGAATCASPPPTARPRCGRSPAVATPWSSSVAPTRPTPWPWYAPPGRRVPPGPAGQPGQRAAR